MNEVKYYEMHKSTKKEVELTLRKLLNRISYKFNSDEEAIQILNSGDEIETSTFVYWME